MEDLTTKIKNGKTPRLASVEHYFNGRWIKHPTDRIYYLVGFVKITDYETDETIIFKMPERSVYKSRLYY
jgi:hypothetical protein